MEPLGGNTADPSWSDPVSTKLERIATLAKQMPDKALFTLNHCLDRDLLLRACLLTRKDGAVGVDGQTYEEFREELFERLDQLVDQAPTQIDRPVALAHRPFVTGTVPRPIHDTQHFLGVGQRHDQRMVSPGAVDSVIGHSAKARG